MESPKGVGEFPEADPVEELNTDSATTKDFTVDPISSQLAESKEHQEEQSQASKKEKEKQERNDAAQKLKSAIIISGVVVAVVGAIFAITKKLREK